MQVVVALGTSRESYYRARYYDTATGRFVSEDSAGLAAGPDLYAYGFNSAINASDPSGMDPRCSTHWVFTWCNWWWPGSEQPPDTFKQQSYYHEMQHQQDNFFLSMMLGGVGGGAALATLAGKTPAGCRILEGRAFAAEKSYLKKRIQALQKKKCLSEAEKKELEDLNQGLQTLDNLDLKDYCSHGSDSRG